MPHSDITRRTLKVCLLYEPQTSNPTSKYLYSMLNPALAGRAPSLLIAWVKAPRSYADAMPRHGYERTAYLATTIDARPILRELAKRLDFGLKLFGCFRFQRHAECQEICSADRGSAQDRSKSETHQPVHRNLGSRKKHSSKSTNAMLPCNIHYWGTLSTFET